MRIQESKMPWFGLCICVGRSKWKWTESTCSISGHINHTYTYMCCTS